jgi:S1-C subfamily serine protease
VASSSAPPGAWATPSRLMNSFAISLPIPTPSVARTISRHRPAGARELIGRPDLLLSGRRYQGASAAGTAMVLTSSREVLTNNHVIAGATGTEVLAPNTTRRYSARVVGYDTSADIAVLQLRGASGLKTVRVGDASKLGVGSHVTAVGNARGTGSLTAAKGTVTG